RRLSRAPSSQTPRLFVCLDHTRDLSTGFDLDLPVGDRAGNVATGADQKALVHDKVTLDAATHISIFRRSVTSEDAGLANHHVPAVLQVDLHATLDDEPLAGRN